ncbi:MAG: hypothetical protein KIH62_001535 [Candidatus Kerfeldbacteria bacterium]|nr:hypothetical protein [Candidatus Kerfeldbacteria bacterium]
MQKMKKLSALALLGAVTVSSTATAQASSSEAGIQIPLVQVNESGFGDTANTSTRLVRMTPEIGAEESALYAITTNVNGIQLWKSTKKVAREWEQVSSTALTQDATNVSVVDVSLMDEKLYVLVNAEDGFEVWQWSEENDWVNVYEQHGSNTLASMMKKADGKLYVASYSTLSDFAHMYVTADGSTWDVFGEVGLAADVGMVTDVAQFKGDMYAVTDDGRVFRSQDDGPTFVLAYTSSVDNASFLVTRKQNGVLYFGGSSASGALLMATSNGADFTTVTQDGFGNSENTAVTQIKQKGGRVHAYMQNGSGFEMYRMTNPRDNSSWDLWIDAGATDADNTEVTDVVSYRGHRYFATQNSVDGTQVGLHQLRAPRVQITSPEKGSAHAVGEITFTGTAQPGNRVDLRQDDETLGTTIADENGEWSMTITVTEAGTERFRVYAQYLDDEGNPMGRLSHSRAISISIQ